MNQNLSPAYLTLSANFLQPSYTCHLLLSVYYFHFYRFLLVYLAPDTSLFACLILCIMLSHSVFISSHQSMSLWEGHLVFITITSIYICRLICSFLTLPLSHSSFLGLFVLLPSTLPVSLPIFFFYCPLCFCLCFTPRQGQLINSSDI